MVEVNYDFGRDEGHVVLSANCSASWLSIQRLLLFLGLLCFTIAISFSWFGFWPILPFAGFEIGALAVAFYVVSRRQQYVEILEFTPSEVLLSSGRHHRQTQLSFSRAWSYFQVEKAPRQASDVFLCCHQEKVALGVFLNKVDKAKLVSTLKEITVSFQQ
ncbi:DUF2244 domain-containing protein [Algicola sagamiensis]|uniref:DUF2244 domain-containing protein n=1 Tax=Algicola sagamiensis TaxID=163869 RepID=UPI00037F4B2D|nr:DUF2244 domain-containing protein [Algicola sagamiensis]